MYVLIALTLFGQVAMDPAQADKAWLLSSIRAEMLARGKFDVQEFAQVEQQIAGLNPTEVATLVAYFQQLKRGASRDQIYDQATRDLQAATAYRDQLRQELAFQQQRLSNIGFNLGIGYAYPGFGWPNAGFAGFYPAYGFPGFGGAQFLGGMGPPYAGYGVPAGAMPPGVVPW